MLLMLCMNIYCRICLWPPCQKCISYTLIRQMLSMFRDYEGNWQSSVMPQSHPTRGPVRFLAPVLFLAPKAEWSARRNFTPMLFSWSHQAIGPVRLDTAVHVWFDHRIQRTTHGSRAVPVRVSYGPRTGISNVFHILRDPYGAHAGPASVPYGALTGT